MILTITANPAVDRVYFVKEFCLGEVHRPPNMTYTAGGKGINVARVAKILGQDTAAMGFVGGYNGQFILEEISKLGIADYFTQIDGETRVCVNISTEDGKSSEILESGPKVTPNDTKNFLDLFEQNIKKFDIITISGSTPEGVGEDFYAQLIDMARENNKRVILDTAGKALARAIKSKPFMVKPNKFELSKLFGKEIFTRQDVRSALDQLVNAGVELPIVSLGKEGAMAYFEGRYHTFTTPDVDVINTVGSGDSFVAGVAVSLSRGSTLLDAIRLGMACGTANTQFKQTGMVSRELVDKFYHQIQVK